MFNFNNGKIKFPVHTSKTGSNYSNCIHPNQTRTAPNLDVDSYAPVLGSLSFLSSTAFAHTYFPNNLHTINRDWNRFLSFEQIKQSRGLLARCKAVTIVSIKCARSAAHIKDIGRTSGTLECATRNRSMTNSLSKLSHFEEF